MADQPLPSVQIASSAAGGTAGTASGSVNKSSGAAAGGNAEQVDGQGGSAFAQLLNGPLSKGSPQAIAQLVHELQAKLRGEHGRSSDSASGGKDLPPDQVLAALLASLLAAQAGGQQASPHAQGASQPSAHLPAQLLGQLSGQLSGQSSSQDSSASQELALLARELGLAASGKDGGSGAVTAGSAPQGDAKGGAQPQLPAALVKLLQSAGHPAGDHRLTVAQAVHAAVAPTAGSGADASAKQPALPPQLLAAIQQAISHSAANGLPPHALGPAHGPDATAALSQGGNPTIAPPVQPSVPPSQSTPALPTANIQLPMQQPGWDQALGERVKWMIGQHLQGAELRVTPAHLGPIDVRISVHNDQASVAFSAQHALTREHLEAAIPRLREMLGGSGLNLANVNVSQHSFGGHGQQGGAGFGHHGHGGGGGATGSESTLVVDEPVSEKLRSAARVALGAIDYFA